MNKTKILQRNVGKSKRKDKEEKREQRNKGEYGR